MATRYAVASGNYSNPAIWDNGAVPLLGDDVYTNGFTIVVDQNITANIMSNGISAIAVPDIATPAMTSNITPSGIVFSGGFSSLRDPYFAFDQNSLTFWQSSTNGSGVLGYQYPTSKIIKRYAFKTTTSLNQSPQNWTFEGSNDGVTYTTLDTVTGALIAGNSIYTSSLLANTTAYLYYRINITLNRVPSQAVAISEFEMTESTGTILGVNNGGTFQHTSGGFAISANTLGVGASNLILYTHASGTNTLNVANNVVSNILSVGIITIASGDVNMSIPQISNGTQGNVAGILVKNGSGTLNFIGNVTSTIQANTNYIFQLNAGQVNITGDVNGSSSSTGQSYAVLVQGATLTVTGNITGGGGTGLPPGIIITSGNLTVIGNITGGATAQGVSSTTTGAITVTGTITAGAAGTGLSSSSTTATVQVSGPLVNSVNGIAALYAAKYFITGASTTITAQSSAGVNNVFYNNTSILDALSASNVRNGISFGLGGALTGTLKVPLPSQVIVGVETDDTVGTWALIPQDFWNYATSNITDADTIGARLKNASTVDTTGAQLTAFL